MRSFDPEVAEKPAVSSFESEIGETARWLASPRFEGITRLYSARQVVEQRGTIPTDYTVARIAAEQFYDRLRQLLAERRQITTFGPYSPGQAVALKRMGIEGIYLGGWATSARGSVTEDPGPDLASYHRERRLPLLLSGRTPSSARRRKVSSSSNSSCKS